MNETLNVAHPAEPLLASVGLDRFLRVHSTASRCQLAEVYLKQHLTGVAFCPAAPPKEGDAEGRAPDGVERKKKKKQRRRVE